MPTFLSSLVSSFYPSASPAAEDKSMSSSINADADTTDQLSISRLITYPIKSCAGTEYQSSDFTIAGLAYDRRWMVVEAESKKMMTARTCPKLFLVQPRIDVDAGVLRIRIPNEGSFTVPLEANSADEAVDGLQVWGSYDLTGHIVSPPGSPLAEALSSLLGEPALLIRSTNDRAPRVLGGQKFLDDLLGNADALDYPLEDCTTEFADGYPYLVATEQTFVEVERWLIDNTKDIRMETEELIQRYRPNIVIKGNRDAFAEDSWEEIRLGSETFYPVSRCPRCPMPDASPKDGTMSARRMPGTIVAKFRTGVDRIHKGPCLGMNALSKSRSGTLNVGEAVEIVKKVDRPEKTNAARVGEWLRPEDRW